MTDPTTPRGRVLLIDDEPAVRVVMQHALRALGYEVETAATGDEGVASVALNPFRFRAAILDVTMPGMSTEDIFARLGELSPGLPILLMSGLDPMHVRDRFAAFPVAAVLPKPCELSTLGDALRLAHGD